MEKSVKQDTVIADLLEESPVPSRRGFSTGSVVLIIGAVLALARRNTTQPTSGPAPDFTMTTFDGNEFRLSEQWGKVVVINFWASWCVPCRDEAPILQSVWERYRERGVILVGVDYADTESDALAFIEEFNLTYPNGPDMGTIISSAYRIQGVPETFVVDRNGNIAAFIIAPVREGQLDTILDGLLEDGT